VKRLESLDAFRGFAIASMILVNNPGDWGHLYAPLAHAKWNGATFTDTVFPFFLFAAGMAMAVSVERRRDEPGLVMSFVRRSAVIFLVGLFLNLYPYFNFETVRIPGVLQRIALCVIDVRQRGCVHDDERPNAIDDCPQRVRIREVRLGARRRDH